MGTISLFSDKKNHYQNYNADKVLCEIADLIARKNKAVESLQKGVDEIVGHKIALAKLAELEGSLSEEQLKEQIGRRKAVEILDDAIRSSDISSVIDALDKKIKCLELKQISSELKTSQISRG